MMWIYQGLIPKLIHIAPLELEISGSLGMSPQHTLWFIKAAGVAEIIFGVLFILLYRWRPLLQLNLFALLGLLAATAIQTPHILMEAFNPVTTNLPLMVLSYYLYLNAARETTARNTSWFFKEIHK